jgi:CheY-like chemotaxis protein/HAMP domain-containing protein
MMQNASDENNVHLSSDAATGEAPSARAPVPAPAAVRSAKSARKGARARAGNGHGGNEQDETLQEILDALQSVRVGDFSVRLPRGRAGIAGKIADSFNEIVAANERMADQLEEVGQVVGREGETRKRVRFGIATGAWSDMELSVNALIDDLVWPTTAVARAIAAVARGDLMQTVPIEVDGRPLKGEFLRLATIVNTMIEQLSVFTSEVTRVAREVGTDEKLGGPAIVPGVAERTAERENALAQVHEMQELETLGQLTGGLAHDFNNVLMAILGNLDLVSRHLPDGVAQKSLVDAAIQAAERGAALTKRMLAFARRQEPRPEAVAEPADAARLRPPPALAHGNTTSYAILLVDDDPMVSSGASAMLQDLGHRVIMASSAALALEIICSGAPLDLVITDHAMPSMTGTELAKQIRELKPDLPIVLASGYAEVPSNLVPGMTRLDKPYRTDKLAATIAASVAPKLTAITAA